MRHNDSPLLRALAVVVAIAVGIRVTFWLLQEVWPYLFAVLFVGFAFMLIRWYRKRW